MTLKVSASSGAVCLPERVAVERLTLKRVGDDGPSEAATHAVGLGGVVEVAACPGSLGEIDDAYHLVNVGSSEALPFEEPCIEAYSGRSYGFA